MKVSHEDKSRELEWSTSEGCGVALKSLLVIGSLCRGGDLVPALLFCLAAGGSFRDLDAAVRAKRFLPAQQLHLPQNTGSFQSQI